MTWRVVRSSALKRCARRLSGRNWRAFERRPPLDTAPEKTAPIWEGEAPAEPTGGACREGCATTFPAPSWKCSSTISVKIRR